MRDLYRDFMLALAVLLAALQVYFAWRGPRPADSPAVQVVTGHPVVGLIVVAVLFLIAGVLNSAPLLRRLLPTRKPDVPSTIDETDWRTLYLEANAARSEYQQKYADVENRLLQLQKAHKPLPQHPIPELAERILLECKALQALLGTYGDKVKVRLSPSDSQDTIDARLNDPNLRQTRIKFSGDYRLNHEQLVLRLRDEIRARCAISDDPLEQAISFAKSGTAGTAENVEEIIVRFWDIARNVNI